MIPMTLAETVNVGGTGLIGLLILILIICLIVYFVRRI